MDKGESQKDFRYEKSRKKNKNMKDPNSAPWGKTAVFLRPAPPENLYRLFVATISNKFNPIIKPIYLLYLL